MTTLGALILRAVAVSLFLLSGIAWLGVVLPGMRMFADHFEVVNETDDSLEVTPVGFSFHKRLRVPLPELSRGPLNLPVVSSQHTILPRRSITLSFDADDHGLSDLLIEGRSGGPRWMSLSAYPTGSPLERPSESVWVIRSVEALPPAPYWLRSIGTIAWWRTQWLIFAHLAFLPAIWLLRRAGRWN